MPTCHPPSRRSSEFDVLARACRPVIEALEVRRLMAAGDLDTTFGDGGAFVTGGPLATSRVTTASAQHDGKLVVVGYTLSAARGADGSDFFLARYNANGSLDTSFGDGGVVTTDVTGRQDLLNAVAVTPDGRIVVAGEIRMSGGSDLAVVARYNADGTRDLTFGTDGVQTIVLGSPGGNGEATAVAIDAASGILVGGAADVGTDHRAFVARLDDAGSLLNAFGAAGVHVLFGADSQAVGAVAADPHSAGWFVAGRTIPGATDVGRLFVARLGADGAFDASFGTTTAGMTITAIPGVLGSTAAGNALAIGTGGHVIVAGSAANGLAVARFEPSGALSTKFSSDGWATLAVAGHSSGAFAHVHVSDASVYGTVTAAGYVVGSGGTRNLVVAQFDGYGTPVPSFGYADAAGFYPLGARPGYVVVDAFAGDDHPAGLHSVGAAGWRVVADAKVGGGGFRDAAVVGIDARGRVDRTFALGGFALGPAGAAPRQQQASPAAVAADGSVVFAQISRFNDLYRVLVRRFAPDGSVDHGFGIGGWAVGHISSRWMATGAVTTTADGSIYVGGTLGSDLTVFAFTAGGARRPLWGQTEPGLAVVPRTGHLDSVMAIAVDPLGRVVVGGMNQTFSEFGFLLARVDATGSVDTTFGTLGRTRIQIGTHGIFYGLAITADNGIVAVGAQGVGATSDWVVARFGADGLLNPAFGNGGLVVTDFAGQYDTASLVAIDAAGRFVVAGRSYQPGFGYRAPVARYLPDGTLDRTFSPGPRASTRGGMLFLPFGGSSAEIRGLTIDPVGRIVIGFATPGPINPVYGHSYDFVVARLLADGRLDPMLGGGTGIVMHDVTGTAREDSVNAIGILPDGRITVAGFVRHDDTSLTPDLAAVRFAASTAPAFAQLTSGGRLNVAGTAANDVIEIADDDAWFYVTLNGVTMTFARSAVGLVSVDPGPYFGTDDDIIRIRAADVGSHVPSPWVSVANNNSGVTRVEIDDSARTAGGIYDVRPGRVITSRFRLDFAGDEDQLWITGGAGDDTFRLSGTHALRPVTLVGAGGDDVFLLGGEAVFAADAPGSLDGYTGPLAIDGGDGNDRVMLNDRAETTANTYVVTGSTVRRNGVSVVASVSTERVALLSGSGNDTFYLGSVVGGTALAVDGGGGDDAFDLGQFESADNGATLRRLGGIDGSVTLAGGAGIDSVSFRDDDEQASGSYALGAGTLTGLHFATIHYGGFERRTLATGTADSFVHVAGATVATTIRTSIGDDLVTLMHLADNVRIETGAGDDGVRFVIDGMPASTTPLTCVVVDTAGSNWLEVDDSASAVGDTFKLYASRAASSRVLVTLDGFAGPVRIRGGAAADTFRAYSSAAARPLELDGGGGADTFVVGSYGHAVTTMSGIAGAIELAGGVGPDEDTVLIRDDHSSGATGYVLAANRLTGTGFAAVGFTDVESFGLFAGTGANRIAVSGATIARTRVSGGAGDDVVVLGADGSLNYGRIDGGLGADTLDYTGRTANVAVNLASGTATGAGALIGFERVTGGSGNDAITGDDRANTLRGGAGIDRIFSLGGNDDVDGGSGNDVLVGGAGNDSLFGAAGNDRAFGDAGNDRVGGGDGDDQVDGGADHDTLFGYAGNDTLAGGAGNDHFTGGIGRDRCVGGDGDDRVYAIDATADVIDGGRGTDAAEIDGRLDLLSTLERILRRV